MPDKLEPQDEPATLVPEARLAPGRPPKPNRNLKAVHVVAKKALGPSLHLKPYSQSYGVGLAEGVMAGGWLGDAGSSLEADFGEGGAKRGEYEVFACFSNANHNQSSFRHKTLFRCVLF